LTNGLIHAIGGGPQFFSSEPDLFIALLHQLRLAQAVSGLLGFVVQGQRFVLIDFGFIQ
jgi:hypothetical protein